MQIVDRLRAWIRPVRILPFRLVLEPREPVEASVARIRGLWGVALHETALDVYRSVFEGTGEGQHRAPSYVLRAFPQEAPGRLVIEWILLGPALECLKILIDAWGQAADMGLGSRRVPFRILEMTPLDEAGCPAASPRDWSLGTAMWPLAGNPARTPCTLGFPTSVRIMRRRPGHSRSTLVMTPTPADVVVAVMRRLGDWRYSGSDDDERELQRAVIGIASKLNPGAWKGEQTRFSRYSGRQQRELDMEGVIGTLPLPGGPGPLWPLFAAATWVGVGKGTTVGLGRLWISALPDGETP